MSRMYNEDVRLRAIASSPPLLMKTCMRVPHSTAPCLLPSSITASTLNPSIFVPATNSLSWPISAWMPTTSELSGCVVILNGVASKGNAFEPTVATTCSQNSVCSSRPDGVASVRDAIKHTSRNSHSLPSPFAMCIFAPSSPSTSFAICVLATLSDFALRSSIRTEFLASSATVKRSFSKYARVHCGSLSTVTSRWCRRSVCGFPASSCNRTTAAS
mmetsp:Transcript_19589/g.42286  ORF Transcript_19589/g.42286 Transcript_19589/m.42286 type:complete len:216 (-) Transcript_19589:12-659(-)